MDTSKQLRPFKELFFPRLHSSGYSVTSPEDIFYNCIAWAAGEENTEKRWDPFAIGNGYHWPQQLPRNAELDTFTELYKLECGYSRCKSESLEEGFEKIAIYVGDDGKVKHAARQLQDGTWTSKLGDWEDINHASVHGVCGKLYGNVARIMKRPLQK